MQKIDTLSQWNELPVEEATAVLLSCCASRKWAEAVTARRPYPTAKALETISTEIWWSLQEEDWMEAFAAHPRIGESKAQPASEQSTAWSKQEQSAAQYADETVRKALAEGNLLYEKRFGFIYLICATGKTALELLRILQRRLSRDRETEIREAAEQQRQITAIRMRKWLAS